MSYRSYSRCLQLNCCASGNENEILHNHLLPKGQGNGNRFIQNKGPRLFSMGQLILDNPIKFSNVLRVATDFSDW